MFTHTPPATPPTPTKYIWILCQFVKKSTNTESSWQIIPIRNKIGRGVGRGVCGLGEWGRVSCKWIFLTKNPIFLREGIFYKLTRNPNMTKIFFVGGERGEGGGRGRVKGGGRVSVRAWTNVSNDTSTLLGEHLCKIILKSMHICRSYGPEKLIFVTFKCDLDLQFTLKNVSNGTSPPQGQQLCQIILKFMHKCWSYDPDKSGRMHARAHNAGTYSLTKR